MALTLSGSNNLPLTSFGAAKWASPAPFNPTPIRKYAEFSGTLNVFCKIVELTVPAGVLRKSKAFGTLLESKL
ncbi:MAG: hypothetical protein ACI4UV_05455 [Victivallales bacterium]